MERTALHQWHTDLGAKMVDFAGWEMPVMYGSIIEEHHATRQGCTIFDVSHMGRLRLDGADAQDLLERLCTRNISAMTPTQCRYSHMCNDNGGILDDVIVSRFEDHWLVVCNASNREKIVQWITQHSEGHEVTLDDQTKNSVMVAIQGPHTLDLAEELIPIDISRIKRYHCESGTYMGIRYICSRTGYTGEDGFEIIVDRPTGKMLANSILETEERTTSKITPAGLGARDTLRLEAGMPLYGHELHEDVDPISAGQSWCVDLKKDFIGADALRKISDQGPARRLVGLEIEGKRIARSGSVLALDGQTVGQVTSGTLSPTLGRVIAMAYVDQQHAEVGTNMHATIRDHSVPARIVPLPFYQRPRKKT